MARGLAVSWRTPVSNEVMQPDLDAIVNRIVEGDSEAEHDLARTLSRGLRLIVTRRIGYDPDADRVVGRIMALTIAEIRAGQVNASNLLMELRKLAYARTVAGVDHSTRLPTATPSPAESRTNRAILEALLPMERELLCRYYLDGQTAAEVCVAMGIDPADFRRLKSLAGEVMRVTARSRGASA
jgi:hypothetical protein